MEILSVFDPAFQAYGQILEGYDCEEVLAAMEAIPMPVHGTAYAPGIELLEKRAVFPDFRDRAFGGMPIQLGMCWGYNTKLNCLEYHRDSEVNLGDTDFVLLLARREEIVNGMLDTAKVKAFRVPKGVPVELYATTLHYAPCQVSENGFRVAVVLPKDTNTEKPAAAPISPEDRLLFARNKWLLAHPESSEAKQGAHIGLFGNNLDIND